MDGQNNGSHYLSVHHFVFNNLRQKVAQPKAEGSCLPPPLLVRSSLLAENTADDHPANRTSFRYGETMSKQTHSLSRRSFLKMGTLGVGGLTLPGLLQGRGGRGRAVVAQIGDPDLSGRRTAASGHVRSEARMLRRKSPARGGPSPPTSPASRFAKPFRGWRGSWTSWSSSARWSATRPTTTPFRSSTATIRASRPRPAAGRSSAPRWPSVQGPVDPATPPFISLCYTCTHGPYNEPGPGFLGTSLAPFRPDGPVPRRHGAAAASRSSDWPTARRCCASFDDLRRDVDATRHACRAWMPSPSRPSGCSRPRGWPRPSTCPEGDPPSRRPLRHRRPERSSWTATAPRACRKAC